MNVSHYLHTALVVTDLDQASYFYGQVLGLSPIERSLKFPGIWYQIGPVQIHLIQAERVLDDRINLEKWGRNRHFALAVTDLDAAQQQLVAAGFPVQMSASGRRALFTTDPDGNVVELSEI